MDRLLFVYNANSGKMNAVLDSLHKITNPSTYNCNLCTITFGVFTEDDLWKTFRENSPLQLEFYHRDEFKKKFNSKWLSKFEFPIVLSEKNGEFEVFITTEELNGFTTSEALIEAIMKRATPD
ncbi:GTPase [Altibacter sp.]|uniref:GTPase n=1 Tax=Altibacter sp. TaxID=2024823 RepID=UPI0025BEACB0|nr:GTPase [Altibacter sp.]